MRTETIDEEKLSLNVPTVFSYYGGESYHVGTEFEGSAEAGKVSQARGATFDRDSVRSYMKNRNFKCAPEEPVRSSASPDGAFARNTMKLSAHPDVGDRVVKVHDWVTLKCNLSCPYCYVGSPAWTKANPSLGKRMKGSTQGRLDIAKAILDNVKGVLYYTVIGGEPTLVDGCLDIVDKVSKLDRAIVHLYTNLTVQDAIQPLLDGAIDPSSVEIVASMHLADRRFDADRWLLNVTKIKARGYGLTIIGVNHPLVSARLRSASTELVKFGMHVNMFDDVRSHNEGSITVDMYNKEGEAI